MLNPQLKLCEDLSVDPLYLYFVRKWINIEILTDIMRFLDDLKIDAECLRVRAKPSLHDPPQMSLSVQLNPDSPDVLISSRKHRQVSSALVHEQPVATVHRPQGAQPVLLAAHVVDDQVDGEPGRRDLGPGAAAGVPHHAPDV